MFTTNDGDTIVVTQLTLLLLVSDPSHVAKQACSQGGSLGVEESPSQIKGPLFCLKRPQICQKVHYFVEKVHNFA